MANKERCCCNCERCIRVKDSTGRVTHNECEIDGHYIGYVETFDGWCRHWKKETKVGNNNG